MLLFVDWDLAQLRALSAAVSEGSFDAAASALHVTPSAISQRIKALESTAGRVLLVRAKPIRVTVSGQAVLRLARQVEVCAIDAAFELGPEPGIEPWNQDVQERPMTLPIAVNADSLATWVLPALAPLAGAFRFDLHREDQEHTSTLLREGTVMAAITGDADPVSGCSSTCLGSMRYRPMASPGFAGQWFPEGVGAQALARAPVVVFDRKDHLQHRYLRRRSRGLAEPPVHYVPSSADFLTAVRLGLGWGMLPDLQSSEQEKAGHLVALDPRGAIDVVLHWQQWRMHSASLDQVANAILDAARTHLN